MTKFNPQSKPTNTLTFGDVLEPAMHITDQKDADQYKVQYVAFVQEQLDAGQANPENNTAEEIVNNILGYYAGYYSDEVRMRVEELFKCKHPIFGSIKENGSPSAKEAFEMGKKLGSKL